MALPYDFQCRKHGPFVAKADPQDDEARRSQPCPQCGKPAKRIIVGTPTHFVGSGFYCKDSPLAKNPASN